MKVTLKQVLQAMRTIRAIEAERVSPRFAYGIAKNKGKMQADIDGIAAAEKPIHDADKLRIQYCKDHAEKDEKGKPVVTRNEFVGVDVEAPEYVALVDAVNDAVKKHEEFLKGETEIGFHMIAFEELPKEISPQDFENLSIMISEPKA